MEIVERSSWLNAILVVAVLGTLAACGGGESEGGTTGEPGAATATEPARQVEILSPAEGDTVQGPSLVVRLAARGFTVAMAGDTTPNTGHHHLFLDRDVSPPEVPIPTEAGYIVHMGNAATEYTFDGLQPGEHRLIAVVGNAFHIPLQPWVADTARFIVR
jgi:hypothetical protein